jgi:transcription elongation GreA/GreB family factor
MLDKMQILQAILERLSAEFENHQATSKMTRAASNDAETKSEGKYDTRSTEENYLADGLAKKALVAAQSAKAYKELPFEKFGPNQPIDLGALVELSFDGERAWFFLGPAAGGIEIECAGKLVTVVTRGSPLGNQIYGKKVGDWTSAPKAKIVSIQ